MTMKKEMRMIVSPQQIDKDGLAVLKELQDKGFIKDGKLVYDEASENEVMKIVNRLGKGFILNAE